MDLISQLADAIVSLINAKPQSPTKAEIEDVVHIQLQRAVLGIGSYPFFDFLPDKAADTKRQREFLTERIRSHGAHELPSVSKTMLDARDAISQSFKARIFNAPSPETPLQSHWVPATLRAAQAAWRECPHSGHYGEHNWHAFDKNGLFCQPGSEWDASNGARVCICGARKPA